MKTKSIIATCVAITSLAFGMVRASQATPIDYVLTLAVDNILYAPAGCSDLADLRTFTCSHQAGETWSGGFSVDAATLDHDGIDQYATMTGFSLNIGEVWWKQGVPSDLKGFRNPALGAANPAFIMQGGVLMALLGGVYGVSDTPFVDFLFTPDQGNRFIARDLVGTTLFGTLNVKLAQVPEPGVLALLLCGLIAWPLVRRFAPNARR